MRTVVLNQKIAVSVESLRYEEAIRVSYRIERYSDIADNRLNCARSSSSLPLLSLRHSFGRSLVFVVDNN
jgi:hypothetical protein